MLPADTDRSPYLSIVVTGRNDGFGGDFARRFLATLQFNHRELSARGVAHEFVLVEWAPIAGAPLLADLVEAQCPPSLTARFRTIVVDPAYQDAVTLHPRVKYQEFLAKNVGVRRCRGPYVLVTNCDIFLGQQILERLARRELEPAIVYRAPRWDLKSVADVECIDWAYLDDEANLVRPRRTLRPPYFSGGAGDFIALDRASFDRLRGFNEVYRVVKVGIDGNFVVHALSCGLAIVDIGGPVYHLDHEESYRTVISRPDGREAAARRGDDWPADAVVYRNRPGWGLSAAPERPVSPRRTYLDFAWHAVPPFVDLSGIVLPSQRRPRVGAAAGAASVIDAVEVKRPRAAAEATTAGDAVTASAAVDAYDRAVRELRAEAVEARGRIERAAATCSDVQTFARRLRRRADKIAARRRAI